MQPHTTRIFVFLESMYCSEDFHHAVEHRFFEHESIKNLENEEHTSISAYAHVTGILFKIITARWSKEYVMRVFDEILSDIIPPFSPEEQKRFLQEWRERLSDQKTDLVEASPIYKELECPVLESPSHFSDFIRRSSIITVQNGNICYEEKSYKATASRPKLENNQVRWSGKEFHLVMFHEARNPQDFIYEAIYTEYVRAHLKKLFTQNGKAYTVWSNSYYESGYVNTGHYWYLGEKNKFSYKNEDLHFDPESFSHMKNRVLFDTKIGHEEHSFAFNVITQLAPDLEWNLLEWATYEGFLEFVRCVPAANRLYTR